MTDSQVLIGTCGYSYDEWREVFYPRELPERDFLRYYSLVFPFVELDFSWYGMPKASTLAAMAARTAPGFRFALKAHRSLTHEVGEDWAERAAEFTEALGALTDPGKLAAVLIQLPYRFAYTAGNRRYLADLCSALEGFPLAVEFRNDEWHGPRVFDELQRRNIALVVVDRPDLPGLPPETPLVTAGFAYYRLHGRNSDDWWKGDATSRYAYDYSEAELSERAKLVALLAKKASLVLVAFNNHANGRAAANAQTLTALAKKTILA